MKLKKNRHRKSKLSTADVVRRLRQGLRALQEFERFTIESCRTAAFRDLAGNNVTITVNDEEHPRRSGFMVGLGIPRVSLIALKVKGQLPFSAHEWRLT